jgi:hypothetical protein
VAAEAGRITVTASVDAGQDAAAATAATAAAVGGRVRVTSMHANDLGARREADKVFAAVVTITFALPRCSRWGQLVACIFPGVALGATD